MDAGSGTPDNSTLTQNIPILISNLTPDFLGVEIARRPDRNAMTINLVVPANIERVIQEFDQKTSHFNELEVQSALAQSRSSLQEPSEAENHGAWAEILAFSLTTNLHKGSPWGTHFGPIASLKDEAGKVFYRPDIQSADKSVLDHWKQRAVTVNHPVLKARYADLTWDLCEVICGERRDPDMARTAIDAYIVSAAAPTDAFDRFESTLRALDLAGLIRDNVRIEQALSYLVHLHGEAVAKREGPWWLAFERLIFDKRLGVDEATKRKLVEDVERLVLHHSNTADAQHFDPHATESAAKLLIRYYARVGQTDDVKRLHRTIAQTFEHFASLGNAMVASSALQTAVNAYRKAGLPEESKRARVLMQEKTSRSREEMATFETNFSVPRAKIEQFVNSIVDDDLGRSFVRFASHFLTNKRDLEKEVQDLAQEAPLQAHMSQNIIADDHVVAVIGSVEEDLPGRTLRHAVTSLNFAGIWMQAALDRMIERHKLTTHHFVGWANRLELYDDLTFLIEGVQSWFEGDFTKAVHVLIPQVEHGLLGIVGQLNKPTTKQHPTVAGASVVISMGDILYSPELTEALGPDLALHLLTVYADPRGMNLRNRVAHGLIKPASTDEHLVRLLIHTLAMFGVWKNLAEHRR